MVEILLKTHSHATASLHFVQKLYKNGISSQDWIAQSITIQRFAYIAAILLNQFPSRVSLSPNFQ